MTADKAHRRHAIIEQVHAGLNNSALAHLPSGVFTANAAWLLLAVISFNLTRAAAALTTPDLARATTATVRRILIQIPCRVATRARRSDHASAPGPALQAAWTHLNDRVADPPTARPIDRPAGTGATQGTVEQHWQRGQPHQHGHRRASIPQPSPTRPLNPIGGSRFRHADSSSRTAPSCGN